MEPSYKYDVAFSFTQKDEPLAFQLYRLLQERLNCFIYSEAQKELAGRDGESVFNSVFEKESRIVVIIHRNNWGQTKWTRIEETAVRNRGYEEGYDFTIVIPLDKPTAPPKWLPKNRIWIGLERWGTESAASVIEARVQEFGGTVKEKTFGDIAAETERKIREGRERQAKINLETSQLEFPKLIENIERIKKEIEDKATDWHIQIIQNVYQGWNVHYYGYIVSFQWQQQYRNSLTDAFLDVYLFKGYINERGEATDPFNRPEKTESERYSFHINELDEHGWKSEKRFLTSGKLVEYWMEKFVKSILQEKEKKH